MMKSLKLKVVGAVAAATVLTFSTVAMAGPADNNYCRNLSDNWSGSFGNWADWIAMCV